MENVIQKTEAVKSTNVRSRPEAAPLALKAAFAAGQCFAPALTVQAAQKLFMTPQKFKRPERELRALKSAHSFRVRFDDHELAAWSWGDGPTVLLVHGWSGRGSQLHSFVEPLVQSGFSVVTFDAPGHGDSGGSISSMIHFARAIKELADWVGPVESVVAHSLGGAATTLALSERLSVNSAVMLGMPADPTSYANWFSGFLGLSERTMTEMIAGLERRFGYDWGSLRVPHRARGLDTPALLVQDREDLDVDCADAIAISSAWPASEVLITEGLGHYRILRDGEVIRKAINFIQAKR